MNPNPAESTTYKNNCGSWAKTKAQFKGSVDTLLDTLNAIRLAATFDASGKPGRHKVTYQLEQLDESQRALAKALGILDAHTNRPQLKGVGVYTSKLP